MVSEHRGPHYKLLVSRRSFCSTSFASSRLARELHATREMVSGRAGSGDSVSIFHLAALLRPVSIARIGSSAGRAWSSFTPALFVFMRTRSPSSDSGARCCGVVVPAVLSSTMCGLSRVDGLGPDVARLRSLTSKHLFGQGSVQGQCSAAGWAWPNRANPSRRARARGRGGQDVGPVPEQSGSVRGLPACTTISGASAPGGPRVRKLRWSRRPSFYGVSDAQSFTSASRRGTKPRSHGSRRVRGVVNERRYQFDDRGVGSTCICSMPDLAPAPVRDGPSPEHCAPSDQAFVRGCQNDLQASRQSADLFPVSARNR